MNPRASGRIARVLLLAVAMGAASPGFGGATDPTLALSEVSAESGTSLRLVRLVGVFPSQDLVQLAYPLQVLVRETGTGTGYVRYDLASGAFVGQSADLVDGLDPGEAAALVGEGTAAPDAGVAFLGRDAVEVLLPASFPAGPAEAQVFALDAVGGPPILSNAVALTVGDLP